MEFVMSIAVSLSYEISNMYACLSLPKTCTACVKLL